MRAWFVLALAAAAFPGCAGRLPPEAVPPAPVVVAPPPPAVLPPPTPAPILLLLDAARRARQEGDLEAAERLLTEAITLPGAELGDRAWVRLELALLHADPVSPLRDESDAEFQLNRLAAEAPDDPAAAIGAVLLRLLTQSQAAARSAAEASASAAQLSEALAGARSALERREQELERIKQILLGDPPP